VVSVVFLEVASNKNFLGIERAWPVQHDQGLPAGRRSYIISILYLFQLGSVVIVLPYLHWYVIFVFKVRSIVKFPFSRNCCANMRYNHDTSYGHLHSFDLSSLLIRNSCLFFHKGPSWLIP
jgi:hypothetical protein